LHVCHQKDAATACQHVLWAAVLQQCIRLFKQRGMENCVISATVRVFQECSSQAQEADSAVLLSFAACMPAQHGICCQKLSCSGLHVCPVDLPSSSLTAPFLLLPGGGSIPASHRRRGMDQHGPAQNQQVQTPKSIYFEPIHLRKAIMNRNQSPKSKRSNEKISFNRDHDDI
jgi:hypothetical protein